MHDLTGFQRDLLYVIGGLDRPNGLRVKAELEDYYTDEITVGRVYPNINTLVDMGLVKKAPKNDRANEYQLTDRGLREIQARYDWEAQYVAPSPLADDD